MTIIWKTAEELKKEFEYTDRSSIYRFARNKNISSKKDGKTHLINYAQFKAAFDEKQPNMHSRSGNSNSKEAQKKKILDWLLNKEKILTIGEISRRLDRSRETVIELFDMIKKDGIDLTYDEITHQAVIEKTGLTQKEPLVLETLKRNVLKIGVVSDMQLGSKYQQLTLLHTAYKTFDDEKVDFILNPGDVFDGINMYKGHVYELFMHGYDDQLKYGIEYYPESKRKRKTYMIGGNHDFSFKKTSGANIVKAFCEKRPDLVYRGDDHASFFVEGNDWFKLDLLHPSGGVAYARSYKSQKQTEAIVGETMLQIREHLNSNQSGFPILPMLILCGHYHISNYMPAYLGIDSYLVPCLQSQTPYLKAKALFPIVGFLIICMEFDSAGNIIRCVPDFRVMNPYVKEKDY